MFTNSFTMGICFFLLFVVGSAMYDGDPRWFHATVFGVGAFFGEAFLTWQINRQTK